jgi:hypothetical protein
VPVLVGSSSASAKSLPYSTAIGATQAVIVAASVAYAVYAASVVPSVAVPAAANSSLECF